MAKAEAKAEAVELAVGETQIQDLGAVVSDLVTLVLASHGCLPGDDNPFTAVAELRRLAEKARGED